MSAATVTAGKCSWVGSSRPNARHFDAPKLKVDQSEALTFVHLKNPVPDGDTVSTATLRLVVAVGASGSFTFTARRVASRVDWSDLTWNNKPGVSGGSATAAVTDPAEGDVVEFTVSNHVQNVADGDPNYGWRIESDNMTAVKFWGFDSDDGPQLEVEWSSVPATPTDLVPQGVVSLAAPYVQFSAPDSTGDDELNAVQVQIDAASSPAADADGTWTSPDFDSGTFSTTVPEIDLDADTAYAGMADADVVYYHVRWRNSLNVWSDWSDTVSMTRSAKSSLTIDNPPVGATVLEPTPPFLATFGGTAKSWRIRVVETADPSTIVAESGKKKATSPTDIAWTPDREDRLQDDTEYKVIVDVWDDVDRVRSVGDPEYTRATRVFTVDDEVGVTAPTAVSVTTDATLPLPVVNFTRASAPDFFAIKRDGETVETLIDPSDVFVSGTSYAWVDHRFRNPMVDHVYKVRAIVNNEQSAWSDPVIGHATPKGLWLISLDRNEWVRLAGDDITNWSVQDEVGVFKVHGRSQPVLIRSSLGALGGSFSGVMMDDDLTRSINSLQADLADMRRRDEPVLLICADYAARVRIYDVTDAPHPQTVENRIWRRVSFQFVEADN